MNKNPWKSSLPICALALVFPVAAFAQTKNEPGTVDRTVRQGIYGSISNTSITPFTTETGLISLSVDALGTNDPNGGVIQVQKAAGATLATPSIARERCPRI